MAGPLDKFDLNNLTPEQQEALDEMLMILGVKASRDMDPEQLESLLIANQPRQLSTEDLQTGIGEAGARQDEAQIAQLLNVADPRLEEVPKVDRVETGLLALADAADAVGGRFQSSRAISSVRGTQESAKSTRERNERRLEAAENRVQAILTGMSKERQDELEAENAKRQGLVKTQAAMVNHPFFQLDATDNQALADKQEVFMAEVLETTGDYLDDPNNADARAKAFALTSRLDAAEARAMDRKGTRQILLDLGRKVRTDIGKLDDDQEREFTDGLKSIMEGGANLTLEERLDQVSQLHGNVLDLLDEKNIERSLDKRGGSSDPRIRNVERMMDDIAKKGGNLEVSLDTFPVLRKIQDGSIGKLANMDADQKGQFETAVKKLRTLQAEHNRLDDEISQDFAFVEQGLRDGLVITEANLEDNIRASGAKSAEEFFGNLEKQVKAGIKENKLTGTFREGVLAEFDRFKEGNDVRAEQILRQLAKESPRDGTQARKTRKGGKAGPAAMFPDVKIPRGSGPFFFPKFGSDAAEEDLTEISTEDLREMLRDVGDDDPEMKKQIQQIILRRALKRK